MIQARFEGESGRAKLVEALRGHRFVGNSGVLARRLADAGEVLSFDGEEAIIKQGDSGDDVFFVVSGRVDVLVNGQRIAERQSGDMVGEMAIVDPSEPRSATVMARVGTVVLRVSAAKFQEAVDGDARASRYLCKLVGNRLRERARFHQTPNETPVLFIGSSAESVHLAQMVQVTLKHENVIARPWSAPGVFKLSGSTLDDLRNLARRVDFALLVFAPDDRVESRGENFETVRDNVLFEAGLFFGCLGRDRVYMLMEHGADAKLPSDLDGVTPLFYVRKSGDTIENAIDTACIELKAAIRSAGPIADRMCAKENHLLRR